MGDLVPFTEVQEDAKLDATFFSDLVESYWNENAQNFDLRTLKVTQILLMLHEASFFFLRGGGGRVT
jgi:hypothetical protein